VEEELGVGRGNQDKRCLSSTLASGTVIPSISLVLLPVSKVYQIRSFIKLLSASLSAKIKGEETVKWDKTTL
jgi:hypothetical protein